MNCYSQTAIALTEEMLNSDYTVVFLRKMRLLEKMSYILEVHQISLYSKKKHIIPNATRCMELYL